MGVSDPFRDFSVTLNRMLKQVSSYAGLEIFSGRNAALDWQTVFWDNSVSVSLLKAC